MNADFFLSPHQSTLTLQSASDGWRFDPLSFALGFAVALLLVALIQRQRAHIRGAWEGVKARAIQLRQRLTADMATRYSDDVIETAQTMHLFGTLASLDRIYVDIKLHAPLTPLEDGGTPLILTPEQAIEAGDRLIIIGPPGSGRTTLVNHLLLLQAGRLHARGEGERVPTYIFLPALAIGDASEEELAKAPAARLVDEAVASLSRVVAAGVARWLHGQVETGNALVLLDGWDQVPGEKRSAVTAWIRALASAHPANRLVVVAGERGYAPLVEAGFVPLRPLPWSRRQLIELTKRWAEARPVEGGKPPVTLRLPNRLTPPTPLQATIDLALQMQGRGQAPTQASEMASVVNLLLPPPEPDDKGQEPWPLRTGHRVLGRLAFAALLEERPMLERDQIQSAVAGALPQPRFIPDEDEEEDLSREAAKKAREEKEQRTLQVVDCCRALTAPNGPIRGWSNRRYLFTHPLVTAYLAARYLADEAGPVGVSTIIAHADDPAWRDVVRFYGGMAPAEPLVQHLMNTPDDIFLSRFWTAADLLANAPPGRGQWRSAILARLSQLFLRESWPAPLRSRALVALVDSGEEGVDLLLKKAAGHPDPLVRAGAASGLGVLGDEGDLGLVEAALNDEHPDVRLAGVDALSRWSLMGSERALEALVAAMIESEEEAQRAAAETLANLGKEGRDVLRDAASHEDLMLRRAAIYGLVVVGEPWALELVEKMQVEDSEWLVRNAAAEALASIGAGDEEEAPLPELALPQAESEPWLIAWAAEQGEGTGVGEAAMATLTRALTAHDPYVRHLAVETMGRLGDQRALDALRRGLRDPEPWVREAALVALEEISRRHDITVSMGK